jgi:uncharacterized cupredoxin-like copper-binding protein
MLLVACSGGAATTSAATSTPPQATPGDSTGADRCAITEPGPGSAVAVGEGAPIRLDTTSVDAGPTTFTVTNDGLIGHELVVLRTDLAPNKLPLTDDGKVADERGPGVTRVGTTDLIDVGCAASLTLHLQTGTYVLICNLPGPPDSPGHYEGGMVAPPFTVV